MTMPPPRELLRALYDAAVARALPLRSMGAADVSQVRRID